jgi:hypothetical protein
MNKKFNSKTYEKIKKDKPISVEDEFIGIPVGKKGPKKKKSDLTKDLQEFLAAPITLDSIKDILLRMQGRWIFDKPGFAKIKVYALTRYDKYYDEFLIMIKKDKHFKVTYYLTSATLCELEWMGSSEDICRSMLKQHARHEIYRYFCNNQDEITKIE